MNYGEEQKNELEALSEIYFNEIKMRPQASNYDDHDVVEEADDDEDEEDSDEEVSDEESSIDNVVQAQGVSLELRFDLPLKYPDEKPSVQILNSQNIQEDDLMRLMDLINKKADESLGTVMVFTLVSDVIEWLITKTEQEANEIEYEKDKRQKEIEEEERKQFEGTLVTEATFLAWKAKFDAEMLKLKFELQKQQTEQGAGNVKRLTGRAMFESDTTLAESDLNFVEDLDQNQIEALLHNIEEVDLEDENFDLDLEDDDEEYDLEDEEESEDEEEDDCDEDSQKNASKR